MEKPSDPIASASLESRRELGGLDAIFAPHTVAVIGATENGSSIARTVVSNLGNPRLNVSHRVGANRKAGQLILKRTGIV